MKLKEALGKIAPVVGMTSLIAAPSSISDERATPSDEVTGLLEYSASQLAKVQEAQDNAQSDAAYWGYEGQRAYWQAVVYIAQAAEKVGPDNLPDVEAPDLSNGVVMDLCARMERWGKQILEAA